MEVPYFISLDNKIIKNITMILKKNKSLLDFSFRDFDDWFIPIHKTIVESHCGGIFISQIEYLYTWKQFINLEVLHPMLRKYFIIRQYQNFWIMNNWADSFELAKELGDLPSEYLDEKEIKYVIDMTMKKLLSDG